MAPVAIDHPIGAMNPCDSLDELKAARNGIHAPQQASATSPAPRAHTRLTLDALEDLLASDNGTVLDGHNLATGNVVGAAK